MQGVRKLTSFVTVTADTHPDLNQSMLSMDAQVVAGAPATFHAILKDKYGNVMPRVEFLKLQVIDPYGTTTMHPVRHLW